MEQGGHASLNGVTTLLLRSDHNAGSIQIMTMQFTAASKCSTLDVIILTTCLATLIAF